MTVPDWLAVTAAARPRHAAVIAPDGDADFATLDARASAVATGLRARGIADGACVASLLPNGLALATLVHAAPRAAAVVALLDPRTPPAETVRLVRQVGARLVVAEGDVAGCPLPVVAPEALPVSGRGGRAPAIALDAPHTIVCTSGTSGTPTAVTLTAGNHLWSALASAARLGAHGDDRWLACLPCWHVGGLAILLRGAILGATVVVHRGFDLARVMTSLAQSRITMLSLVPTTLARVADTPPPTWLRVALVGGAAASPALLRRAQASGWPVAPTYGCTEAASQIATAAPGTPHATDGSVGLPLLPTLVRVLRADGTEAPPGEDGVIAVRGPTVAPAACDAGGWLRTNDVGRLAPDGALTVLGRRDDVIVSGGENVAPTEVEAALAELPEVGEVAVAGVPDAEWGTAVTAWVVARPGTRPTLDGVRAAARALLPPHKLPTRLFVVDALPRTASGKVRRTALRARDGG